jgi:hypothetical protein
VPFLVRLLVPLVLVAVVVFAAVSSPGRPAQVKQRPVRSLQTQR